MLSLRKVIKKGLMRRKHNKYRELQSKTWYVVFFVRTSLVPGMHLLIYLAKRVPGIKPQSYKPICFSSSQGFWAQLLAARCPKEQPASQQQRLLSTPPVTLWGHNAALLGWLRGKVSRKGATPQLWDLPSGVLPHLSTTGSFLQEDFGFLVNWSN